MLQLQVLVLTFVLSTLVEHLAGTTGCAKVMFRVKVSPPLKLMRIATWIVIHSE